MPLSHDQSILHVSTGITGNPNVGFSEVDLEGDFDPASYDQTMGRAFDDEYYVMEEEGGVEEGEEEGKPVFSDDEDGGKSFSLPSLVSPPSLPSLSCHRCHKTGSNVSLGLLDAVFPHSLPSLPPLFSLLFPTNASIMLYIHCHLSSCYSIEMYGDWDQWDPQQDPHCEDLDFNVCIIICCWTLKTFTFLKLNGRVLWGGKCFLFKGVLLV